VPLELEIYGMQQLLARLANLKSDILGDVVESELRAVAIKIRDTAKAIVPVKTRSLQKSIRLQVYAQTKGVIKKIGVSAGGYVTNPDTGRLVDYARWVEFGTHKMRERSYMRVAMYLHMHDIPIKIVNKLRR